MTLFLIIIFSLLGSAGLILVLGGFLLISRKIQSKLVPYLVSYATGALLASAFLGLLSEALEKTESRLVFIALLLGIMVFFLLERWIIWRHCHLESCTSHQAAGPMILVGDAFHNSIDGVVIAASFLASVPLGIATSIAVIAHELPQEIGDFGILLHSGYPPKKAILYNLLSSLTTLPTAVLAYFILGSLETILPYVMAISAASFIYIALTDLYPELHRRLGQQSIFLQFVLMLLGAATIMLSLQLHH